MILGTAGHLMAPSIREAGVYYLTPSELKDKVAGDRSGYDKYRSTPGYTGAAAAARTS